MLAVWLGTFESEAEIEVEMKLAVHIPVRPCCRIAAPEFVARIDSLVVSATDETADWIGLYAEVGQSLAASSVALAVPVTIFA